MTKFATSGEGFSEAMMVMDSTPSIAVSMASYNPRHFDSGW